MLRLQRHAAANFLDDIGKFLIKTSTLDNVVGENVT